MVPGPEVAVAGCPLSAGRSAEDGSSASEGGAADGASAKCGAGSVVLAEVEGLPVLSPVVAHTAGVAAPSGAGAASG